MESDDKAWTDYRDKFASLYDDLNYSSPAQKFVMRASHVFAEKAFRENDHFDRVLEIGAGTAEHFPFVRHGFNEYVVTDADSKTLAIAKTKLAGNCRGKLTYELQVGDRLTYPDNAFDRVVAVHVLEHIYQPHLAVREWLRVLKDGGVLTVLIPTDPGVAWRLGRHFGPRKNAMKRGIAYDYVMAREHVNSCTNLVAILRHQFRDSSEGWWPLPIASLDINLFFVFHAKVQKQEAIL